MSVHYTGSASILRTMVKEAKNLTGAVRPTARLYQSTLALHRCECIRMLKTYLLTVVLKYAHDADDDGHLYQQVQLNLRVVSTMNRWSVVLFSRDSYADNADKALNYLHSA